MNAEPATGANSFVVTCERSSKNRAWSGFGPKARSASVWWLTNSLERWLPWEGSNSDIPKWISAFEISREFRLKNPVFTPGDFSAYSGSKWEPGDNPRNGRLAAFKSTGSYPKQSASPEAQQAHSDSEVRFCAVSNHSSSAIVSLARAVCPRRSERIEDGK